MIGAALQARVAGPRDGRTYQVGSDLVTFKAVAAETNGAYSLFEARTEPGRGTPLHRQRYEDEAFWVLEGIYTFQLDNRSVMLGAGSYAFAPRGTVHAYTNSGDAPARMLILVTPGGIHERFFAEVGELVEDRSTPPAPPGGTADLLQLRGVAQKYGIEMLAPSGV